MLLFWEDAFQKFTNTAAFSLYHIDGTIQVNMTRFHSNVQSV